MVRSFDVVIVGAGLSGIGAAWHLQDKCPGKTYCILEGRDALGGTWDLFRYPGIRSDSDMHTLGYSFKPWLADKAIADGPSILKYLQETSAENGIDRHIHYGHEVRKAWWSSADTSWTIEAERGDTGESVLFRCNLLLMCAGYYSYTGGYTPEFPGTEHFNGEIIHPQNWPEDFEYDDKNVVVIGSGATAMTLVPAMANDARQVTLLQRSPTYVISRPARDVIANALRRVLPGRAAYTVTRVKNISFQRLLYRVARIWPKGVKRWLAWRMRRELGQDFDIRTHFEPNYNPWDQRLCLVPDNDLFEAINSGKAVIVTDHIDTFTEKGILLKSGRELEADIIITATGLNLVVLGKVEFLVDEQSVDFPATYTYKGMMYSNVPNLVSTFGYINASWTLRSDLIAEFACRLIKRMDETGSRQCTPRLSDAVQNMPARDWIDNFSSNYIRRVMHLFPKQGDREPWINPQVYSRDKKMIGRDPGKDGVLEFR